MSKVLTTIEQKIFDRLSDGEFHTRQALQEGVLNKRFASASLVPTHIDRLRKKISAQWTIEAGKKGVGYRMVAVVRAVE